LDKRVLISQRKWMGRWWKREEMRGGGAHDGKEKRWDVMLTLSNK
jgi:hypothetical protein